MFGNNGWDNAGGSPNATGGGYPVVTVTEDFNIEAQPNTFYNIKNSADDEVNINCSEGYSIDGINSKHIMFTFDGWEEDEIGTNFAYLGGPCVPDTSKEGYKYRMDMDLAVISKGQVTGVLPVYFSDEVKTGNSVIGYSDTTSLGGGEVTGSFNNIVVINDNIDYLVWADADGISVPAVAIEVENTHQTYSHKYAVLGMATLSGIDYVYTNEPYTTASNFYLEDGTDIEVSMKNIRVILNVNIPASFTASEFVFNINSPANITFNVPVNWNNGSAPDLTQTGVCTISLVNGVGCYTFVNT